MTGIAIVGQGYMGQTHAAAWAALGLGDAITAIVTPHPKEAPECAPNAKVTASLAEALDDDAIDIVSVCTPTTTHREIAVAALAAGKNVLLEKPVALSMEDALAIRQASLDAQGILMVAQVVRFFEGHRILRQDVDGGLLGNVLSARARRLINRPDWATWWHDEERSGGALVDLAIHDFDQMNWFLGRPIAVTCRGAGGYGPFETTIEYADGGVGQVLSYADLAPGAPFTAGISLIGERGLADYELSAASPTEQGDSAYPGLDGYRLAGSGGGRSVEVAGDDPYARQAAYFLECVQTGSQPTLSSIDSAVQALEVALAARESLSSGARVVVESQLPGTQV